MSFPSAHTEGILSLQGVFTHSTSTLILPESSKVEPFSVAVIRWKDPSCCLREWKRDGVAFSAPLASEAKGTVFCAGT